MSLRFCHLTTFYPPHNFGGDGIGVQRLVRALARRGHPQTVVVDTDAYRALSGRDPDPEPDEPGVEVVRLRSGAPRLSMLLVQQLGRPVVQARALRELLAPGRFDVINYHNVSLAGGPAVWSWGDAVKLDLAHEHWLVCPTHVLWRHARELCTGRECLRCQIRHRRPPQPWRATSALERHGRDVDAFVAMSEFSRAKHREFGFPFEMEVVPYFLPDLPPGAERPRRAESGRIHARPYFLFVGRLERIKGLDQVIPLFGEHRDADLVIAGSGEHEPELRRVAEGLEGVRFLGRVPNDELARAYRDCEALIVPSICYETFGIILIEAFRAGAPVIARRLGPFPEIVERAGGGELFSTSAELVAAMRRIQGDPAHRERLAEAGFRAFASHWSESAVVPRYLEVVARAAERKGRAAVAAELAAARGAV
jgi:glycosyltransferase involved in cell wall biosynthesis